MNKCSLRFLEHTKHREIHLIKAFESSPSIGHILEFGVGGGRSMRMLFKLIDNRLIYGFDSFEGLPEEWVMQKETKVYPAGAFKYDPPNISGVEYRIGLFEDTIPKWIEDCPGMIAFLHIDSDLYSSCVTVLELLDKQIVPGTVIVFDEMFEGLFYTEWREGEYKAFNEWMERHDRKVFELNRTEYGEASFRIIK